MRIVTLAARSGWHTDELDRAARAAGSTYVFEVNGIPGREGLQRATCHDVAGAIVEHAVSGVAAEAWGAR